MVAAVTVLLVAGELISGRLFSYDPAIAPTTEEVVVSLALVAPLGFGSRAPVAVFATVMATSLVQLAVTEHVLVADLAPLVALYYLVVHGPGRLKPIGLGVALVGGAVMSWRASFPGVLDGFLLGSAVVTAYVLLAALLADRRVSRRARWAALEGERDQQAEIGAAGERARIARELHDVVAHSLAVMVAQADGGRYAAPGNPDAASRALAQIADTGRDALAQMGRLLGVLRAGEEGGDLRRLVRRLAGAGLPVELEVEGRARELPAELHLCIHRVAQEALTNVVRHADTDRAELRLEVKPDRLRLVVQDWGRGLDGQPRGGGVQGMRERALLVGGQISVTEPPGGGVRVTLDIPLDEAGLWYR